MRKTLITSATMAAAVLLLAGCATSSGQDAPEPSSKTVHENIEKKSDIVPSEDGTSYKVGNKTVTPAK